MKRILFLILVLFVAGACLDDKTNYDYRDINNFDDDKWEITGIGDSYSLFPGESVTITPKVRLSIDTLNPDVEYHWLLNKVEVATTPSYTFEATEYGEYNLIFLATDKKTGVSFPFETSLSVAPLYKLGWLFLSRTASGNSRLSMLAGRKIKVEYWNEDYFANRDSLIYVGFHTNLGEDLGSEPIRLIEEFPYPSGNSTMLSEVMVLQGSGPIELDGNELKFTGNTLSEFMGGTPDLKIKDAALGWSSKWLQADDNRLYFSVANVVTDLHSGRYLDEPAFNGVKHKTLIEVMKAGESYEHPDVFLAIDENNTMWALVDNGDEKYNSGGLMEPLNSVGYRARLKNNTEGTVNMGLFQNFTGRYVKHLLVYSNKYFLSLIEDEGKYKWHKYMLEAGQRYEAGEDITIQSSETGELAAEMFTDFKDAAIVYRGYGKQEWLFVASGNKLYGTVMDWVKGKNESLVSKEFFQTSADIVSIKARYLTRVGSNSSNNKYIHLGVLLADGTFLVLEVNYNTNKAVFTTEKIYEENLKELDPEIVEVVDMIHKYGESMNMTGGYLY